MNLQDLSTAGVSDVVLSSITNEDKDRLIELLSQTTFDHDQRSFIERQIENCETPAEFEKLQQNVFVNMIQDKDRIAMGLSYNAGDIKKALKLL